MFFQSYVFIIALADKSVKLRILIIYMFCFYIQKAPRECLFRNGICLQPGSQSPLSRNLISLKAVKDSVLMSNNVR